MFFRSRKLDQIIAGLAGLTSDIRKIKGVTMATKAEIDDLKASNLAQAQAVTSVLAQLQLDAQTNHDLLAQLENASTNPDLDVEAIAADMKTRTASMIQALSNLNATVTTQQRQPDGQTLVVEGTHPVTSASGNDTLSGASANDSINSASGNDTISSSSSSSSSSRRSLSGS